MSIDLSQFETATDGEWLEILHPVTGLVIRDDNDGPMQVKLVGKDSDEYRKAQRAATERRLKNRSKRNRVDAESIESEAIEILVACTLEWSGIALNGEPLDCTKANARKVYTAYAFLREQVDEFVDDRGNFMKGV